MRNSNSSILCLKIGELSIHLRETKNRGLDIEKVFEQDLVENSTLPFWEFDRLRCDLKEKVEKSA